jgi:hypothetical protein
VDSSKFPKKAPERQFLYLKRSSRLEQYSVWLTLDIGDPNNRHEHMREIGGCQEASKVRTIVKPAFQADLESCRILTLDLVVGKRAGHRLSSGKICANSQTSEMGTALDVPHLCSKSYTPLRQTLSFLLYGGCRHHETS